jgi:hypothetical protein
MDSRKKKVGYWIGLALILLLLLLLMGYCSQQSQPDSIEGQSSTSPQQELASTEFEAIESNEESTSICTLVHPFFPIVVGARWEARIKTVDTTVEGDILRDYGWSSPHNIFEITNLTSTSATLVESNPSAEGWHQDFEIVCDAQGLWGIPRFDSLPYAISPDLNTTLDQFTWSYYDVEYKVVGWQEITVPAGTFEVLCISSHHAGITRPNYVTSSLACFAENVGLVYAESHTEVPDDEGKIGIVYLELVGYSIPSE